MLNWAGTYGKNEASEWKKRNKKYYEPECEPHNKSLEHKTILTVQFYGFA